MVKEFVRTPFIICPDCRTENFGVLMVCDRHYVRRCIHCWFDKSFPLPPIRKKLIYLDQFVISNIAKELDPTRPESKKGELDGFYRNLFGRLDRLFKLQLIICPSSPIQDNESIVTGPHYEKIRAVFRHLANRTEFRDPEVLFHTRIIRAFRMWLHDRSEPEIARSFAITKNPDVWNDVIRIELNCKISGLSEDLKQRNQNINAELGGIFQGWLNSPIFNFEERVIEEMGGHIKSILRHYAKACIQQQRAKEGDLSFENLSYLLSPSVGLMTKMFQELQPMHPDIEEALVHIGKFFLSESFRSIVTVRISALCWATIARHIQTVRPKRLPTAGIYNDIDALSNYAPFCDAMFIDKEFYHFTSQPELKKELQGKARLFCLQKDSKEGFLEYLRSIETEASEQHLQIVDQVYGSRHENAFTELLETLYRK